MTEFILDSAYQAAEQALLDQRLFLVTGSQSQALLSLLDRPAGDNPGLKELFSRVATVWRQSPSHSWRAGYPAPRCGWSLRETASAFALDGISIRPIQ